MSRMDRRLCDRWRPRHTRSLRVTWDSFPGGTSTFGEPSGQQVCDCKTTIPGRGGVLSPPVFLTFANYGVIDCELRSLPGETKRLMERRSMRTIHDHMIRYLELSLYSGISNRLSVVSTVPIGGGYGNTCPECQTRPSERLMVIFATFSLLTRLYIGSDIRKGEKMVECSVAPVPSLLSRPFFLSLRNVPAPSSRQHARFLSLSHLAFLISVIRYL